ncbi:MAG: methyltransferase domain-containing protein [Pirellulales bacterium]|nr:methyltransferase domain-containing protein [Pirellulales bacterium]
MPACVLGAAAELDVFTVLGEESLAAEEIARRLRSDLRATRMLLDAVTALELLDKRSNRYSVPPELRPLLTSRSPETVLPMVLHRMNILRGWSQLAWVAKAGIPAPRQASIRGPAADREAFVAAMHTVSAPNAGPLVAKLQPLDFKHFLDVGGASGTWTMAFLKAVPGSTAAIFDLPDAIQQARDRFAPTEFAARVTFVPGDFYVDPLPAGADFAWLSAIIHQHSRRHNRELFAKVFEALQPGGRIAIRDIVMEPDRAHPVEGTLFAINMLVNTDEGGTFTFEEIAEDLQAAGFVEPELRVKSDDMNAVVMAKKPAGN